MESAFRERLDFWEERGLCGGRKKTMNSSEETYHFCHILGILEATYYFERMQQKPCAFFLSKNKSNLLQRARERLRLLKGLTCPCLLPLSLLLLTPL